MKLMKYYSRVEPNCMRGRMNRVSLLAGLTLALAGLINGFPLRGYCQRVSYQSTTPLEPGRGWIYTGNLNTARFGHTATLLQNGNVLVVGGSDSVFASAELYDPDTGTWSVTGNLNVARYEGHTATLLRNGKVLVAGGIDSDGNSLNNSELYDPDTGTWSITSNLNTHRRSHTATLLQTGKVLVAGGQLSVAWHFGNMIDSADLYDPNTETWSSTSSLNVARFSHTATLLPNGTVLVAGGAGGNDGFFDYPLIKHAEVYDPTTGKWTDTGYLNMVRYLHTAILLPNGKVLVACGGSSYDFNDFLLQTSSAELYDPATGKWSDTRALKIQRDSHTAVLLPNGKVLVAGGNIHDHLYENTPPLNSAELYDPYLGTWSNTLSLKRGRSFHTATVLANGKVLVAGGSGDLSAELYDPGTVVIPVIPVIPKIISTSVAGKKLFILGENFDAGALILLNGEEQITRYDGENPQTTLIAKNAGKKIKTGDKLQVRNPNGELSEEFIFAGSNRALAANTQ
jgi:N-acetylneuraminic acid mutarotase